MPNFVRGRKFGRTAIQLSGAPFLFTRYLPIVKLRHGFALAWRHYQFTVYRLPA